MLQAEGSEDDGQCVSVVATRPFAEQDEIADDGHSLHFAHLLRFNFPQGCVRASQNEPSERERRQN